MIYEYDPILYIFQKKVMKITKTEKDRNLPGHSNYNFLLCGFVFESFPNVISWKFVEN